MGCLAGQRTEVVENVEKQTIDKQTTWRTRTLKALDVIGTNWLPTLIMYALGAFIFARFTRQLVEAGHPALAVVTGICFVLEVAAVGTTLTERFGPKRYK